MKKLICLVLALVMTFALATAAFAEDTMNILSASVLDGGYMGILIGTDYTSADDMNFSAYTENGDIKIAESVVLRGEGTSWFVIMENSGKTYGDSKSYYNCADEILKRISEMVSDKDNGVLIPVSNDKHTIVPEKANILQSTLKKFKDKRATTDISGLYPTVKEVMQYITDNKSSLMPNVAVIIVTSTPSKKVNDDMIEDIGNVLSANQTITTHIIITAARDNYKADRDVGLKLAEKAKLTIGGTGYVTGAWSEQEGRKGVERISDAERRKIYMMLDPVRASNLGKTLTIKQVTAGGKELTQQWEIPDSLIDLWKEKIQGRTLTPTNPGNPSEPGTGNGPEITAPPARAGLVSPSTSSTYIGGYDFDVDGGGGTASIDTWMLVLIIGGAVVVLALLVVLLVLRAKKGKKPAQSAVVASAVNSSRSSASAGTTVTLAGANGSTLKGTMKNGTLTIGRNGAKAMLSVPNDGKLSGLHATLTKQGNAMTITDNGSTNGTKLNGNKLDAGKPVTVQQNDTITLGSTTYTISWRG